MGSPVLSSVATDHVAFRRILCQVDSTPSSAESVSQALMLVGDSGRVTFSPLERDEVAAARALLEAARHHDLVVVTASSGPAASLLLHAARAPVLVTRLRPDVAFPGPVLVATSGLADSHAVLMAACIATAHRSARLLAHTTGAGSNPEVLTDQAAAAAAITRRPPTVLSTCGEPGARRAPCSVLALRSSPQ